VAPLAGAADKFVARAKPDTAQPHAPGRRNLDQLADGRNAKLLLRDRQGTGGQARRRKRGTRRRRGRRGLARSVRVGGFCAIHGVAGRQRRRLVQFAEDVCPGPGHLLQRAEPLAWVAVQRPAEERHEPVAQHRVERILGKLRHLLGRVEQLRLGHPIAPARQFAAGHLVQRDRRRIPLRGGVVAWPPVGTEERVEVVGRADVHGAVRGAGQREVEKDQAAALLLQRADRQVVRFDVAVPDVLPVQVRDRLQQMLAQVLQLVDGQRAVVAQLVGKGPLTGLFEHDDGSAGSLDRAVDEAHDVGVGQRA